MSEDANTPNEASLEDVVKVVEGRAVEEPIDAVIVVKTRDEHGNINTDIAMQGGVEATEVQTLLELAVQGWRQKIGLTR